MVIELMPFLIAFPFKLDSVLPASSITTFIIQKKFMHNIVVELNEMRVLNHLNKLNCEYKLLLLIDTVPWKYVRLD